MLSSILHNRQKTYLGYDGSAPGVWHAIIERFGFTGRKRLL
jgi:hypothetical protein